MSLLRGHPVACRDTSDPCCPHATDAPSGEHGHGDTSGRPGSGESEWRDRLVRQEPVSGGRRPLGAGRAGTAPADGRARMRTVLGSTTAGRDCPPAGPGGRHGRPRPRPARLGRRCRVDESRPTARHAGHHRTAGPATAAGRQAGGNDAVLLGAAVKHVACRTARSARSADAGPAAPRPSHRRPPRRRCDGRGRPGRRAGRAGARRTVSAWRISTARSSTCSSATAG